MCVLLLFVCFVLMKMKVQHKIKYFLFLCVFCFVSFFVLFFVKNESPKQC